MRREDGVAAVELALIGGVLLLLVSTLVPILQAVVAYNDLSRATAEGLRYAVHAAPNPVVGADDCPTLTRWPSSQQVRAQVEASLGRQLDVFDVAPKSPCTIRFDEDRRVVVTASIDQDLGPLAAVANAVSGLFGGDGPFPEDIIRLTATAAGMKE